jgi:hypothetical protein
MKKLIKKNFLGEIFTYKTEVDVKGNALWTKNEDQLFAHWLYDLKEKNRELFKVQFSMSQNAYEVLKKLKDHLGVFDESLIIRAITITFINYVDTRKGRHIIKKLNFYRDSPSFKILTETGGKLIKKNLYFSPIGMRDVEAYSQLTALKKSDVIKNSLYSILLLSIHEEKEVKKFWEDEILEKITSIVKAA